MRLRGPFFVSWPTLVPLTQRCFMTFREAFLIACLENPKATKGKAKLLAKARDASPMRPAVRRIWERMEKKARAHIRKQYGQEVGDWKDWVQVLIENFPAILQILMAFLVLI